MNRTAFLAAVTLAAGALALTAPATAVADDPGVYVSVTVTRAPTIKAQAVAAPGAWVTLVAPNGRAVAAGVADGNGKILFPHLNPNTRPIDYLVIVDYAGQTQLGHGHHLTFKFVTGR